MWRLNKSTSQRIYSKKSNLNKIDVTQHKYDHMGMDQYLLIPFLSIFRGMNIHLPAILMFTRGTRSWHTAILTWVFSKKICRLRWPPGGHPNAPGATLAPWHRPSLGMSGPQLRLGWGRWNPWIFQRSLTGKDIKKKSGKLTYLWKITIFNG